MQYKFFNIFLDQKELLAQSKDKINPFLLENNSSQVEKIYAFYKSNVNLLYVNGFLGTGKAKIVDYSLSFLSSETIVLKYNCFNSTVLDDILLSFFTEFKNLSAQNIILEPKIKTENFTQKINSYFSQIEKPFVIILDSFEAVLEENRPEIIDFVLHLVSLPKVKVILISRTFESKYFENTPLERLTTFALDKPIFEKYLKDEKIKYSGQLLDEFYKHTRGYYYFTELSIKLMRNENLSLTDFMQKMKESYTTFLDFLGKRALTLVSPTERNFFWFLTMIRHPINENLLKKLSLYNEENINFLIENLIITKEGPLFYVPDYIKEQVDYSSANNIAQKIRQYIIDLYLTQLPLRPMERDVCVSRQTMRKEIEHHTLFLPKRPKNLDNSAMDINYLSYAKGLDFSGSKQETTEKKESHETASSQIDLTQRKNVSLNLENLSVQQNAPLPLNSVENLSKEEEEYSSLKQVIEAIQRAELNYQYKKVIDLCNKALNFKDSDLQNYLTLIYAKAAFAYQKVADYENSLKYYNLTQEFYKNKGNHIKANQVKLKIAKIFYETYKLEKARELLLEIVALEDNPSVLKAKAYLQLANLEENTSNLDAAFKYYKKSVEFSDESMDTQMLSEIYFKYALAVDDKNDIKTAIEFYNKCIDLSNDPKANKFLSSAYSNIATLYLEKNDAENAIENYTRAYEIDKESNNLEGMYYSSSKLASILRKRQPENALEYFHTAIDCARLTKDIFYIVSASLALGDFEYDRKENEIALKHYIYALDLATNNLSKDNVNKINIRVNDIKFRMGVEKFDKLVEIIRARENEE